jgi:hypothetical protein
MNIVVAGLQSGQPMVLVFWLRSVEIFRSLPSGKLVSQTSRLGIRPALPTVEAQAFIRNEVARPHHFIPLQTPEAFRNAGSRKCFWFARSLRWFG